MSLESIVAKVESAGRIDRDEALALYSDAPTNLLGHLAEVVRARKHPSAIVTYIIDRNVNYTNVCVARCAFCAFYRPVGSNEGYVLGFDWCEFDPCGFDWCKFVWCGFGRCGFT